MPDRPDGAITSSLHRKIAYCPQITQMDADPAQHRTVANTKAPRREAVTEPSQQRVGEKWLGRRQTSWWHTLDRNGSEGQAGSPPHKAPLRSPQILLGPAMVVGQAGSPPHKATLGNPQILLGPAMVGGAGWKPAPQSNSKESVDTIGPCDGCGVGILPALQTRSRASGQSR